MAIKIIDINLNRSDLTKEHAELNSLLHDGWTLIGNSSYVHEYRYGETHKFSDNTPFERYTLFKPDQTIGESIADTGDSVRPIFKQISISAYMTMPREELSSHKFFYGQKVVKYIDHDPDKGYKVVFTNGLYEWVLNGGHMLWDTPDTPPSAEATGEWGITTSAIGTDTDLHTVSNGIHKLEILDRHLAYSVFTLLNNYRERIAKSENALPGYPMPELNTDAQERIAALEMAISKAQTQLEYAEEGYDRHPSHVMVHIKNAQRHLNDVLNEDTE